MSFSRAFQWYHSHLDPIWPDGTFKFPTCEIYFSSSCSVHCGIKLRLRVTVYHPPSLSSHYLPPREVGRRERGGSVVWLTNEKWKLFPCDSVTACDWSSATLLYCCRCLPLVTRWPFFRPYNSEVSNVKFYNNTGSLKVSYLNICKDKLQKFLLRPRQLLILNT